MQTKLEHRTYMLRRLADNPELREARRLKFNEARQKQRQIGRAKILEYKKTLRCIQCGESDSACLDFHHRNPAEKECEISDLFRKFARPGRLEEELAKCDVLCANCHRKLHNQVA